MPIRVASPTGGSYVPTVGGKVRRAQEVCSTVVVSRMSIDRCTAPSGYAANASVVGDLITLDARSFS